MAIRNPSRCLARKPTKQSVLFGNRPISLILISRSQRIDHSLLSRIFLGKRTPSIAVAQRIANALGLGLEEFLTLLDQRITRLQTTPTRPTDRSSASV